MYITTNGIVVNEHNQILLVQRSDTHTLAPPGGGLDPDELPPEGAAREVHEETGAVVTPTALTAVYFWPHDPTPFLTFSFRCRMEGGRLRGSLETSHVGFFPTAPLPWRILPFHRHRLKMGLAYTGGPPYWGVQQMTFYEDLGKRFLSQILYPYKRLRRRMHGPSYFGGGVRGWNVGAFTVIQDDQGRVLWVKRTDIDAWNLPGGGAAAQEAPWQTAVRETYEETGLHVRLTDLSGVYFKRESQSVIFTFTAVVERGQLTTGPESAAFAAFAPGDEPANALAKHVARVADACRPRLTTHFRFQPAVKAGEQ